jgi:HSP20 family protein
MDENLEFEDKKSESKESGLELSREKHKQEKELKRKQSFYLNQSKDSSVDTSIWGSFKTRTADSLEIREIESYYRTPVTNIIESETEFNLFVELPGLDKKHVNITLHEGVLEIIGDKSLKEKVEKDEKKEKDKKEKKEKEEKKDKHKDKEKKDKKKEKEIKGEYLRREFRSASFFRSFHIPETVNFEGIDASFKYGVLRLRIPKKTTETNEKKVIEIK